MDGIMGKAGEAVEAAKQKVGLAEEKKAPPADAGIAEATKQKAAEASEAAKKKGEETAQYAQDRAAEAAQWTKDSAAAGKDTADSVFQQASGQVTDGKDTVVSSATDGKDTVVSSATDGKDKVVSTLGGDTKPEPPVASKDGGGILEQAGGQVMGAKDSLMNTLGFGGGAKDH